MAHVTECLHKVVRVRLMVLKRQRRESVFSAVLLRKDSTDDTVIWKGRAGAAGTQPMRRA